MRRELRAFALVSLAAVTACGSVDTRPAYVQAAFPPAPPPPVYAPGSPQAWPTDTGVAALGSSAVEQGGVYQTAAQPPYRPIYQPAYRPTYRPVYQPSYRPAYRPAPTYAPGCAENGSCYGDISVATGRPKTTAVRGYYRKNGTYVRGHYRS